MISSIVNGVLSHKRLSPVVHSFKYKHTMLLINLDDIEPIQKLPNFFRYNRFGVLSIRDSHYIDNSSNSINSKILKIFGNEIRNSEVSKCMLLTTPAVFGYSFNPVSFYFLMNDFNQVIGCASEVRNTFGESHVYILHSSKQDLSKKTVFTHPKQLYVSPFIERSGGYRFELNITDNSIDVKIKLYQNNKKVFVSQFSGMPIPFTNVNLIKSSFRIFITVIMTEIRILIQAYILFVRKHLVFIRKPSPNTGTIESPAPGFIKKIARLIKFVYGEKNKKHDSG